MHFYCIDDAKHAPVWCENLDHIKHELDTKNPERVPFIRDQVVVFLFDLKTDKESICKMLNGERMFDDERGTAFDMRSLALRYWMIGPRGGLKEITRAYYLENLA